MSDINIVGEFRGYEEKTVGTAVVSLTSGSIAPTGAPPMAGAVFTADTEAIRWRADGGSPGTTTPFGHLLGTADSVVLIGRNSLDNFRAVSNGTADATLIVSYFR